ncbi:Uncharacterised protein [uncultured archaeon]|nr:Uncharacterised protein [uncultured archaeon]
MPRVVKVRKLSSLGADEERFAADCFQDIFKVTVDENYIKKKPGFFDRLLGRK